VSSCFSGIASQNSGQECAGQNVASASAVHRSHLWRPDVDTGLRGCQNGSLGALFQYDGFCSQTEIEVEYGVRMLRPVSALASSWLTNTYWAVAAAA